MRDTYYELLSVAQWRYPVKTRYSIFEAVGEGGDGTIKVAIREGDLAETDAAEWVGREPDGVANGSAQLLKLLILHGDPKDLEGTGRLRCSGALYRCLEQKWSLPTQALKALLAQNAGGGITSAGQSGLAFCMNGPAIKRFGLLHDPETGVTHALLESWSDDALAEVLKDLKTISEASCIPSALPLVTLQYIAREQASVVQNIAEKGGRIRTSLDLEPLAMRTPARFEDYTDLALTTLELTKMSQEAAALTLGMQAAKDLVRVVTDMHDQFYDPAQWSMLPADRELWCDLADRLYELTATMDFSRQQLSMHEKMIQALVQTVYSLSASRDNKLNYQATEAARRDSSDMRVIAWVTLGFLPATFVATFFSTSFFNWQASSWSNRVSGWMWLYWAVAVPLTVLVILVWTYTSNLVERKRAEELAAQSRPKREPTDYDSDGDQVHWRMGSHDLGGEIQMDWRRPDIPASLYSTGSQRPHATSGSVDTAREQQRHGPQRPGSQRSQSSHSQTLAGAQSV